jgi:hypothetical protein
MSDPLERVLRLVAEGRLTADEAAPILDALSAREGSRDRPGRRPGGGAGIGAAIGAAGVVSGEDETGAPQTIAAAASVTDRTGAKFARIMVMEGGRRVVDLRVPTALGRFALGKVPGLSAEQLGELEQAISSGVMGPLLEVEDPDGDGVRIVLE